VTHIDFILVTAAAVAAAYPTATGYPQAVAPTAPTAGYGAYPAAYYGAPAASPNAMLSHLQQATQHQMQVLEQQMKVLDEQIKQKQKEEEQKRLEEEKKQQEAVKQATQSGKVVLGGQKIGTRSSSHPQVSLSFLPSFSTLQLFTSTLSILLIHYPLLYHCCLF